MLSECLPFPTIYPALHNHLQYYPPYILYSLSPEFNRETQSDTPNVTMLDVKDKVGDAVHLEETSSNDFGLDDNDSIESTQTGKVTWLISMTVSLGGFLFGYDTGVISAVLVSLGTDLDGHDLSSNEQELITSLTSGGALVGAILAGLIADRFGRKPPMYLACAVFVVGSVIQAAAYSLAQMSVGRFVVGLGVGSAAMIIPLYIGELAPAKYRGRMIAFDNMSVTLGQLVSYALGAGFTEVSHGWRYMVGIGAVPALILAALLPLCPESPRQLLAHDHQKDALTVIRRTYPNATEQQLASKLNLIQKSINESRDATAGRGLGWIFKQLFFVDTNRRPLICACVVMAISQLGGFNTLMYYSSTLFSLVGFDKPVAVSIVVGGTNFIFTLFNMLIIDRVGRRRI
jgi:SP family myo-inositol transporter-like MFS transporter 13